MVVVGEGAGCRDAGWISGASSLPRPAPNLGTKLEAPSTPDVGAQKLHRGNHFIL